MPSPTKSTNRRGKLPEKASSFHCRAGSVDATSAPSFNSQLRRPKTVPDLLIGRGVSFETTSFSSERKLAAKPTKVLINVTIQGSVGAMHVLISPESTVGDLIGAVLIQYGKEARRPIMPNAKPSMFNIHYSQFALECLDREEKLMGLGSRNYFMCPTNSATSDSSATTSSLCSIQADSIVSKSSFTWLKFMDFML